MNKPGNRSSGQAIIRYLCILVDYCALKMLQLTGKRMVKSFDACFLYPAADHIRLKIKFLQHCCAGRKVVHLGFADAPFTEKTLAADTFLHLQLKKVTRELLGVDCDEKAVALYKKTTGDLNVELADIYQLQACAEKFAGAEVFVLGEIIEHLDNPGLALQSIHAVMPDAAALIVTVPSALNFYLLQGALNHVELGHPDHKALYSMNTLSGLLKTSGFVTQDMCYYISGNGEKLSWFQKRFPALGEGIIGVFKKQRSGTGG